MPSQRGEMLKERGSNANTLLSAFDYLKQCQMRRFWSRSKALAGLRQKPHRTQAEWGACAPYGVQLQSCALPIFRAPRFGGHEQGKSSILNALTQLQNSVIIHLKTKRGISEVGVAGMERREHPLLTRMAKRFQVLVEWRLQLALSTVHIHAHEMIDPVGAMWGGGGERRVAGKTEMQ